MINELHYIKWTSFDEKSPYPPDVPEYHIGNTDVRLEMCAQYLFDIEISEGESAGLRTVISVYYAYGDTNAWCIPFLCETVSSVFGQVKYLNWMPHPLPRLIP